jgi:hypothetical protein
MVTMGIDESLVKEIVRRILSVNFVLDRRTISV